MQCPRQCFFNFLLLSSLADISKNSTINTMAKIVRQQQISKKLSDEAGIY